MATLTFPVTYGPDWSQPVDTTAKVLKTDFGDGYGLRAKDGINSVRDVWSALWTNLTPTEAQTAHDFLKARGGSEAFYWTPPNESTPRKWVAEKWQRMPTDPAAVTLTVTFTEVFDL